MNLTRLVRAQWDRSLALLLVLVAFIALLRGWQGVSTEGLTALQLPYLVSGGIGGLLLLGAGAALWLSADLRDEWRALERIADELGEANAAATTTTPADGVAADPWAGTEPQEADAPRTQIVRFAS